MTLDPKSRIHDFVVKGIFTLTDWLDDGEQDVPRAAMLNFVEYGYALKTLRETECLAYWGLPTDHQGWSLFNKLHRLVQLTLHHTSQDYSSFTAEEEVKAYAEYHKLMADLGISHSHSKPLKRRNPDRWLRGIRDTMDEYVATQELRYEAQRKGLAS